MKEPELIFEAGEAIGMAVINPRGVSRTGVDRSRRILEFRLSEAVEMRVDFLGKVAQVNAHVTNVPGTDKENPVTIFVATWDTRGFQAVGDGDEYREYSRYGTWAAFVAELEKAFLAAEVMLA